MKIAIIGGVAGGASAAARARRLDESAEILLFERGEYVSFANCGLPYYIGGEIEDREELFVTTPEKLRDRFLIDVRTLQEVVKIEPERKLLTIRKFEDGSTYTETYDKLILSPGAAPVKPPIPGVDHPAIFTVRSVPDVDRIKARIEGKNVERAVVVGGGFIGLEMAEALAHNGCKVSLVEMLDQVLPPMDYEMAAHVHFHLREKGVDLRCCDGVESFAPDGDAVVVKTASGAEIPADLVILSIGVAPEKKLAADAGLAIGAKGGIFADETMQSSVGGIYAVGDAVEVNEYVTGTKARIALAGPANRQGRIAAGNALGRSDAFKGAQGTSVVRVFDITAAFTGPSERMLKSLGKPCMASYTHSGSHAGYFPGSERMAIKLIFDPADGKVLGAQAVGKDGVDKRIDVIATAIKGGLTVYDLEELDLAYAPPYGSAKDPVNMAGMVAANILRGDHEICRFDEVDGLHENGADLIDLRDRDEIDEHGQIPGSIHIPLNDLRSKLSELDKSKKHVVYCAIGQRGYYGYRIMAQNGFDCLNLSGGYVTWNAAEMESDKNPAK